MYNLNSDIPNINTRQKLNFCQHSGNLSLHQKGVHSFGIKTFNSLPQILKQATHNTVVLSNLKQHWNVTYLLLLLHRWIFLCKLILLISRLCCTYAISLVILILYYNLINFTSRTIIVQILCICTWFLCISYAVSLDMIYGNLKNLNSTTTTTATSTVLYTYLKVDIHPPNWLLLMRNNLIHTFSLHYRVAPKNKTLTVNMKWRYHRLCVSLYEAT
jgi:hypothetical protein